MFRLLARSSLEVRAVVADELVLRPHLRSSILLAVATTAEVKLVALEA